MVVVLIDHFNMKKGIDLFGNRAYTTVMKQKLNTGSSTDTELVGISDALGLIMWTKYFMEVQGYIFDSNILFRDNQSTILLANNGRSLAVKNSNHIKNRYLLIDDKVHQEDLEIQYNPTVEMMA